MIKKVITCIFLFISLAVPSFAANWQYLSTEAGGVTAYIDLDSRHYNSAGYTDSWVKLVEPNNQTAFIMIRVTSDRKAAMLVGAEYNYAGKAINAFDDRNNYSYVPISPNSLAEKVYAIVYH